MTRIALVTGAARGLGQVIASRLIGEGWRVAFSDSDGDAARAAARAADADSKRSTALSLDVTRKEDFAAALQDLRSRWGGVHLLVNNAALTRSTPVMEIGVEEFDAVLAVNLRGTFLGCQVFGAAMAQAGHGRIVNLASLAAQNGGTATGAHYAASKGAITSLTKVFARELAPRGVTVNAIAPGPLDLQSVRDLVPPQRLAALVESIPVRSLGSADFVADMVVRLAAPGAGFVTGATWDVNGGLYMR